jgi:hypothetical protein
MGARKNRIESKHSLLELQLLAFVMSNLWLRRLRSYPALSVTHCPNTPDVHR